MRRILLVEWRYLWNRTRMSLCSWTHFVSACLFHIDSHIFLHILMFKIVSYNVGAMWVSEDCKECVCTLGGISFCQPKKCEACNEPGTRPVINELCNCVCKPCPPGTRHCPTSDVCIEENLWCNGVQDCPDDEKDCPQVVETTPTLKQTTESTPIITTSGTIFDETIKCTKNDFYILFFSCTNCVSGSSLSTRLQDCYEVTYEVTLHKFSWSERWSEVFAETFFENKRIEV